MSKDLVTVDVDNAVATVLLRDGARRNPLSDRMIEALVEALHSAEVRNAPVVAIRGESGFFSAGGDLDQFYANLTTDALVEFRATELFRSLFQALEALSGITIALVEGKALGGGFGLAAACDMVLASRSAMFGCPEIKIGAFPMVIVPPLVRAIGARNTLALSVTGQPVTAERARELGLVTEIFDAEEFDERARTFVTALGNQPAHVLTLGKSTVRSAAESTYDEGLLMGSVMRALVFSQQSFHDGVSAFVQRKP
ncbi:enoyl-CoA hydratase/isomerase family protein [Rhodococcus sp. NPDC057014]|uniref:enoyl-CoA hydratase/isomerase family protein n=1 Tax=Rhodococcus sp. NPDC057014 TaxID=3346000 RepID=UPI00362EF247